MTQTIPRVWRGQPFKDGTPADFARLRELLARHLYTAPALCDRLDIPTMSDVKRLREGRELLRHVADPQALLVRLYFDGEPVQWSVVRSVLPADDVSVLETLGLIESDATDPAACCGTVLLYPVEGLYIVSDRGADPDGPSPPPHDVVYPAITLNTHHFMSLFSREPCREFLELCSGAGLAALVAARDFAGRATAVDITERATRFARFNARLNAIEHIDVLQGDLYEPVRGRTFDRIVAHPPYMPASEQQYVYRDGGEDGEQVTRRIIAGLPEFLAPGGRFYSACVATDRTGAPLESRVREMIGDRADEFDVVVLHGRVNEPSQYFFERAREGEGGFDLLRARIAAYERLQVEGIMYSMVVVQRRGEARPVFTARRQLPAPRPGRAIETKDVEWLLRWEELSMDRNLSERLLDAAPRRNPQVKLRQLSVPRGPDWEVERTWLDVVQPYPVEVACPYWVPIFLAAADGRVTGREHLALLKRRGLAPEETPDSEFAAMLVRFMGVGMFDIAGFPLPSAPPETRDERVRMPPADQ